MQPGFEKGQKAPDFIALLPDGEPFKFSDLQGQYILLDFWGSWCGPCVQEAPALISLYDKYKNSKFKAAQGFTIVSVGIEKDRNRWLNAIEKLGKEWPLQIIDPASSLRFFNSPIANEYGVKQVPVKFLIDEQGVIIGVDMTVEQMDQFLQSQL